MSLNIIENSYNGELIGFQISKMESRLKKSINDTLNLCRSHDWGRGLSRKDAAAYIGLSTSKFDSLIGDGRMPKPIRIDGRVVWDRHDLDEYFENLKEPDFNGSNSWFEHEPRKES